ncbi:hypothetical protein EVAR_41579_1 [Eumeta japonica]|uniref:Biogenesis of lysosome-related organelles complex 1 subunit 3 n=1 Tax=Eumeta variegata TaxID=151549 RepID=A0A4C1XXX9_EUMVA|nr:hypothetical protein EVAR_41579_1 [Eumeta japonica]
MSQTAHVVEGEASESDSEVEVGKSPESAVIASAVVDDFVVSGEASESDDDSKSTTITNSSVPPSPATIRRDSPRPSPYVMNTQSLLHQKLWECNVSLRATLEGLLKHTTELALDKLSRADKTLLNVQESMRSTNANLTLAKARLKQIEAGLEKANCGAALPTVKV